MSVTLIAYPLNDSNTEVPYVLDTMGGTDVAITYSISDIEDVTKRRGSFSKTITLPNTPTNERCFGFAYNIQSFVGGFTPNKKIRAAMWEDGVQVFSGVLQLLSMAKTKGKVTYEVGLFTDDVGLYQAIEGNLLVNTAGVTGMNHTPTSGHVSGTWTASGSASSGYVYGVIDAAGFTDILNVGGGWFQAPWWRLGPSIYVKKMIDLIFTQAGYRYSSNFFNSATFNKLVLPYAAGTMPVNLSGSNIFARSNGASFATATGFLLFQNDSTPPLYDRPGYWVASSSTFVAPALPTRWNIRMTLKFTWATVQTELPFGLTIRDVTNNQDLAVIPKYNPDNSWNSVFQKNVFQDVIFNDVTIRAGTNVRLIVDCPIINYDQEPNCNIQFECLENPSNIGVLDMRTALPADVKQSDLLQDLQKMFNLHIMADSQDPKLLYIEPWVDFYTSGVVDWSQKADENAEQILTNGDPNASTNIIFKYKDMGDYLSKTYKQSYPLAKEGYGGKLFPTQNFYGKGDKVVETSCGTLIPASFSTDKIVGRTWDIDGTLASGTVKSLQTGYRLAQYNLIEGQTEWAYQYGVSGNVALSVGILKMPFISHIDNPYAPTFDLAFEIPRLVYYNAVNASGSTINYTNNNLFNKYWKNYVNETVSKEALQLELTMMLSSVDI